MNKKMFFVWFFVMSSLRLLAMEIDYSGLFLCHRGSPDSVKEFIRKNPTCDINYQNSHGQTPALHAAHSGKWDVVWHLLDECRADKNIKDNYGQSIFSKAVYRYSLDPFKKLLPTYSLEEINALCKEMPLDRGVDYNLAHYLSSFVKDILDKKKDLESKDAEGYTALHSVCLNEQVPLIVELLKRGASLEIKSNRNKTPYDLLSSCHTPGALLFVVREAFNNGACMPGVFINEILEQHHLISDVTQLIKQLYVKVALQAPEARIWKPVCVKACALAEMGDPDENRCLTRILLLPQKQKTELNIKLLLADK